MLPRLPEEAKVLRVVRKYKDYKGKVATKTFSVRKQKVLDALYFLKKYHIDYKDVEIDPQRLKWMGDEEEKELPKSALKTRTHTYTQQVHHSEEDFGSSYSQHQEVLDGEEYYEDVSGGVIGENENIEMDDESLEICASLKKAVRYAEEKKAKERQKNLNQAVKTAETQRTIQFPRPCQKPINEYDTTINLLPKAYP